MAGNYLARFKVTGISHSAQHKATRYALSSVLATDSIEGSDVAAGRSMARLIDLRRAQLCRLRETGWAPLAADKQFGFVMNCPPYGVLTDRRGLKPCTMPHLCPFCWCRYYVGTTHQRFARVLFPPGQDSPQVELHEYIATWVYPFADYSLDHVITKLQNNFKTRKIREPAGATSMLVFDVTEVGWRASFRQLSIRPNRPRDFQYPPLPYLPDESPKSVRSLRRTRLWYEAGEEAPATPSQILVAAIGRLAKYPEGLLYGNAARIRELQEGLYRHHVRSITSFGKIRGRLAPEFPEARVADDL